MATTAGSLMVDIGMNVARLQQDARRATSIIESSTRQMTSSLNTFKNIAMTALAFTGVNQAVQVFTTYNKEMESAKIGIASLLVTQGRFTDAQGQALEGNKKIAASYAMTSNILTKLEKDNLATAATFGQLREAFQKALGPGLAAGLNVDQIRQFSVAMVQAGTALGVPLEQMGQEVRSVLSGNITEDSMIARTLGITNDDIKRLKGNSGALFDFLQGKLKGFKEFGDETQRTYGGLVSNISDTFGKALGTGTKPFFEALKVEMSALNEYMVRMNATTGQMELNPEFMADMEALNTLLIGMLNVASGIGEFFSKVVIPPIRSAIEAFSSLKSMTGKTGFTGGGLEAAGIPQGGSTVAATDVDAMNKAATEYLQKIKEAQEVISNWKAGGSGGEFLGTFQIANAEFDVSRYTDGLADISAHLKQQGQDTSELERAIAELKGETQSYVRDGMDPATMAMSSFSYQANAAGQSAEELRKHVAELKAQFADLATVQDSVGKSLDAQMRTQQEKLRAQAAGWTPGRAGVESQYSKNQEDVANLRETLSRTKFGMTSGEIEQEVNAAQQQTQKIYQMGLKANQMAESSAAAKKGGRSHGPAPMAFDDIDKQVAGYMRSIKGAFGEIESMSRDNSEEMYKNTGRFYDAERVHIDGWVEESKKAFQDRVDSLGQSVKDMWDNIAKAQSRGSFVTPKAFEAVKQLDEAYNRLKDEIPTANQQIEKSGGIKLDQFRKNADLQGGVDLAQTNVTYAELTGTMQKQYQAQLALIRASEDEKMANVSKDIPGLVEAYQSLFSEQKRIAELKANGSFLDGLTEGVNQINNTLPTVADQGITAAQTIKSAFDEVGRSIVDAAFEGKASFADMTISILKNLATLAMNQVTNSLFSSFTGFLGISGARASGGPVLSGGAYLVGEQGPEIFRPSQSGTIIPNGAGGGGIVVNTAINVTMPGGSGGSSTSDPAAGQRIGQEAAKAFKSEVIRIVQDQMRPGASLNRGLRG